MDVAILATADAVLRDTPTKADDDELGAGPVLIPRSRRSRRWNWWLRLHTSQGKLVARKGIAVGNIHCLAFEIAIVLGFVLALMLRTPPSRSKGASFLPLSVARSEPTDTASASSRSLSSCFLPHRLPEEPHSARIFVPEGSGII